LLFELLVQADSSPVFDSLGGGSQAQSFGKLYG
jgi:hypothetical protein